MQKMTNQNIAFKKIDENDLKLLQQWFQIAHVFKWYAKGKGYTLKEIQEKYLPRINDTTIPGYIVYDADKPVGYIQFYQVKYHLPEGIKNAHHPLFKKFNPTELVGIDLFIADENYLHTGFSSNALDAFINKYIKNNFKAVLVDPDKNNTTAIEFFKRNGFEHILSQDEQQHLMIKKLNENTKYTIYYDPAPKPDETKTIWQGISEHARKVRELPPGKPFAFFIRDELNQIKGGCSGYIYYGCLYVDLLWVDVSLRGKQYGTQLMKNAEKLAQDNQCNFIAVNTMDFEALEFYKKLGFVVEFERKGFDKNSSMYFLRKDLDKYKNKDTKAAFHWIVNILKKLDISFQIAGGLAATIYGANRPIDDIDIDIPEESFPLVKDEVNDFIIYGPAQFKDETWDLMLMTLNYHGQLIDLGGAFNTKIFNKNTQKWQECHADFSKVDIKTCFDLDVPVISKDELLFYKKIIARPFDLIDIEQINQTKDFDPNDVTIDLAYKLIANQFPEYAHLKITDVEKQGHDNRTFRLGENMLIRMPTAQSYALKIPKEQALLPKLASCFTVSIPTPIKMGAPSKEYPYPFSIYKWLKGVSLNLLVLEDNCLEQLAFDLAKFLNKLESIDHIEGPAPGQHNWWRGDHPSVYDQGAREQIARLSSVIDSAKAIQLWEKACNTRWNKQPVWIHGDMAIGNLLIHDKKLSAVIDFGGMCLGDPACDLVIAWTFFHGKSRNIFIKNMKHDEATWLRAKAWTLWKATFELCEINDRNHPEFDVKKKVIETVLRD